jgi:signal peptidase II
VWLFYFGAAADRWLTVLLGCVMAGVLGNLYDRLGLHGDTWLYPQERLGEPAYAVRDWILLQWNAQYRWPNFNIADALLVVSAIILAIRTVFEKPEKQTDDASKEASSVAGDQLSGTSPKQVD